MVGGDARDLAAMMLVATDQYNAVGTMALIDRWE